MQNSGTRSVLHAVTGNGHQIVAVGENIILRSYCDGTVSSPLFNGDGRSDLVWRHESTGQVYGMLMDGAVITAQGIIYQEADTDWRIVASGDYTGDGKADLLWRNGSTG
ncbi:MAG: VCBS repeat-containing protein [Gammaproteobacteria bacterium]|nr:VCBS repeat-containing protein [Gammaproteobacteria bacterium]